MGDAEKDIAGHLAGEGNQLTLYANSACAANLPEMIKNRQDGMVQAADKRAKALDSAENMAAFFTLSVGLINPAAGAAERDMPQIQVEEKRENDQEMLKLMDARQQAAW